MTIQDLAGNLFVTQSSPMIGFVQVDLTSPRQLQLLIYRFLIEGIREDDQLRGDRFVERFLQGPQEVWNGIDRSIRLLPNMWSIAKCEDRFLPYLKWIVGWTSELDYITDDLDSATLRRLIAASVPFWKIRGGEPALADILQLITGARVRVWNWFDIRWICGETIMSEEHQGYDPWMLSLPGAPNYDENRMNVRIVDDGTLNRKLVRNLVKLTRPAGERITISYIGLLDLFTSDGDTSQWTNSVGATTPTVANGMMLIGPTNSVYANVDGAESWQNYVASVRFRGPFLIFEVYRTGDGDNYLVYVDTGSSQVALFRFLAGTPTPLVLEATYDHPPGGAWFLSQDLFYTVRVEISPELATNRIQVWLDGNLMISTTDATHDAGGIAFSGLFTPSTAEIDEVELFFLPLEEDVIDINS